MRITGVMIEYYFICKKKLWYFANQIQMEDEHENVVIGKVIDENAYPKESKHLLIDGTINIDFIRQHMQIHEVKKSKSIEEASIWQVKYYLYYLRELGMDGITGVIDYPLLRRNVNVEIEKNDKDRIEQIKNDIINIISMPNPPITDKKRICGKCAYYEMCFI